MPPRVGNLMPHCPSHLSHRLYRRGGANDWGLIGVSPEMGSDWGQWGLIGVSPEIQVIEVSPEIQVLGEKAG